MLERGSSLRSRRAITVWEALKAPSGRSGSPPGRFASAHIFCRPRTGPMRPGCVVLDVRLPEVERLDLQREMRAVTFRFDIVVTAPWRHTHGL